MNILEARKAKIDFVHRIIAGKPAKKIYQIEQYVRGEKAWELTNVDDIGESIYLKSSAQVTEADY